MTHLARTSDPETSRSAPQGIPLSEHRAAVLEAMTLLGEATDEELLRHPLVNRQTPSGIRTRRAELVRLGLVVNSGHQRPTERGCRAVVWRLA